MDLGKRVSGADNRSRTYDLRITNALLYQLSYIGEGIVLRTRDDELRGDKLVKSFWQVKTSAYRMTIF